MLKARTAILVDGEFFLKRYRVLKGPLGKPEVVAEALHDMCLQHLYKNGKRVCELYRIFVYDCPPLLKKAHHPLTGKAVDFAKSDTTNFRLAFHDALRRARKVALRLGYLDEKNASWTVAKREKLEQLLRGKLALSDLAPEDVIYKSRQKGVDMRIGVDISSLSLKKQVEQIVLVSGDSDFVPAAKMARREGIDFILDPMWNNINPDLHEHIDGLRSVWAKATATAPASKTVAAVPLPVPKADWAVKD